jgi:hypothetical protein
MSANKQYIITYQKKAGYCSQSFSTNCVDPIKLMQMMYWYYTIVITYNNKVIFSYKAD